VPSIRLTLSTYSNIESPPTLTPKGRSKFHRDKSAISAAKYSIPFPGNPIEFNNPFSPARLAS
jgi:hypothetical protein